MLSKKPIDILVGSSGYSEHPNSRIREFYPAFWTENCNKAVCVALG